MKKIAAFVVFLSACGVTQDAKPVLNATAFGQIAFGDRLEDVEKRLGEKAPLMRAADESQCRQIEFNTYPGLVFMIEEGRVTRAETSKPLPTSIGFTVGAATDEIKRKRPDVVVEPHKYEPAGHYLTLKSKDGKTALLMEAANGTVTHVRGGLFPSVQYVEGCL